MRHSIVLLICFISGRVFQANAAVIQVPADQPTIQAGVDAAVQQDTVLVAPGIYSGPGNSIVRVGGKSIAILSSAGSAVTTIDGGATSSSIVLFEGSWPPIAARIEGFTLMSGARGVEVSSGIEMVIANLVFANITELAILTMPGTSFEVRSCVFQGAGIEARSETQKPQSIQDCEFRDCATAIDIDVYSWIGMGPYYIGNCEFRNNGTAIDYRERFHGVEVFADGCRFYDNGTVYSGSGTLRDCTICGGQRGIQGYAGDGGTYSLLERCTLTGLTEYVLDLNNETTIHDCMVYGNHGQVMRAGSEGDPSSFSMHNSIIEDNGGGITIGNLNWTIVVRDCIYRRNGRGMLLLADDYHGSISVSGCEMADCGTTGLTVLMMSNSAVGGDPASSIAGRQGTSADARPDASVSGCTFERNRGDGVSAGTDGGGAWVALSNCTSVSNEGHGVTLFHEGLSGALMANCISSSNSGCGVSASSSAGIVVFQANDVWNNIAGQYQGVSDPTGQDGNISKNPRFCEPEESDYHIAKDSPCHPDSSSYGLIGAWPVNCGPLDVLGEEPAQTSQWRLLGCRPTPSFGTVWIDFELEQPMPVRIDIFDAGGRAIARVADEFLPPGKNVTRWRAVNRDGAAFAPGIYFVRLEAGGRQAFEKIVVIR